MDFVNDVRALGTLLVVQFIGFLAGLMALLSPVLAVLPIPHNPHEWGIALATGVLYLKVRHRERKRRTAHRARIGAKPPAVAPAGLPLVPVVPSRADRRKSPGGAEKHSTKMRKLAK